MILSISMLRGKGVSREEFHSYWLNVHGPLAMRLPGLRKYSQNHFVADLPKASRRGSFKFDGLGCMWFDNIADMEHALASPQQGACSASLSEFVDEIRIVTAKQFQVLPCKQPPKGLAKRVVLLERKQGLTDEQFSVHWVQEHGPHILQYPEVLGYTQNLIVDRSQKIPGIRVTDAATLAGIVELWCSDVETMNSVFEKSQSETGITKTNAEHGQMFLETMTPFLAVEHVILD